jgi:hypothetical protein
LQVHTALPHANCRVVIFRSIALSASEYTTIAVSRSGENDCLGECENGSQKSHHQMRPVNQAVRLTGGASAASEEPKAAERVRCTRMLN